MQVDTSSLVILASGSSARRKLLASAGVAFSVVVADVDEDAIRLALRNTDPHVSTSHIARELARAKSEAVSRVHPDALVIGADQILEIGRDIATKPPSLTAARAALREMSGRTHRLLSAVSLAQAGAQVWQHLDVASLAIRDLSDAFLDDYIARAGGGILSSVGAYELEGLGVQLFERIDGDYFTILGLPLLPLLAELRTRGVLLA
jgi:septum formation protein